MTLCRRLATTSIMFFMIGIVSGCSTKSSSLMLDSHGSQAANPTQSNAQGSAHSTYLVPRSLQFPKSIRTYLKKHCRVITPLPSNLHLDSRIPKNKELAISLDACSKTYGLDIFERPKGSHSTQYGMADFVGDMSTVTKLSSLYIPGSFDTSRFNTHKFVTLSNQTKAIYYQNQNSSEHALIWSNHGWKYIVDVMNGIGPKTVHRLSNDISSFVGSHGVLVKQSTKGYVQVLWLGNRPLFRVTWTYGDKQWYTLSMNTLDATLSTAHTVTRNS